MQPELLLSLILLLLDTAVLTYGALNEVAEVTVLLGWLALQRRLALG